MFILLTNDDGINSDGITTLFESLRSHHRIMVIAPETEMSATSHSISLHAPLRVRRLDSSRYAVNGTPTDCINLALFHILRERPDLIISGINHGPNLGTDVTYSGTVAAAIEGAILGIRSIAVSCVDYTVRDLHNHAQFIGRLINQIRLHRSLSSGTFLNINMPAKIDLEDYSVAITRLSSRRYDKVIKKRRDPRGREYFWIAGEPVNIDDGRGTDVYALRENQISITPLKIDQTDYTTLSVLKRDLKRLMLR